MQPYTLEQLYEEAKSRVKTSPSDIGARSALWQIFAARGEFDRARKQLDLIAQLDSTWLLEVQSCHKLLEAEERRSAVFMGLQPPECLGLAPVWFESLAAVLPLLAHGNTDSALALLHESRLSTNAKSGYINDQPFDWLCDGDARLGPCLEVFAQGRYFWVPWESVQSLQTRPPSEVRDRLWQHAMLQLIQGDPAEVFIPVRYPNPANDSQAMSRTTDWVSLNDDYFIGFGQKCLMTDKEQIGYLDVRKLKFG
jgi:type VI secretion system protein ImpE